MGIGLNLSICIITCRRPKSLSALLEALNRQHIPEESLSINIVLVDNDTGQSARKVLEEIAPSMRWPLNYHVEEKAGIPFARNACLRHSLDTDLIAFIDDDEVPGEKWLVALLQPFIQQDADVATGPVYPVYPVATPKWIRIGRFFDRPVHADGKRMDVAFTNNVCFKRSILDNLDTWFDERMAMSGGSDAHFFRRVAQQGYKIVWAEHADVYEEVPKSRMKARWLINRSFRTGNMMTVARFDLSSRVGAVLLTLLSAARWYSYGAVRIIFSVIRGKHEFVKGLTHISYATGIVAGVRGQHYQEYQKIHGA